MPFTIQGPPVIHQTLDGEVIVVNLDSGTYYRLEGVAAEIWSAIERGVTADEAVEEVARAHDAQPADAAPAVHRFIARLAAEGLLAGDDALTAADSAETAFPDPTLETFTDMQELLLLDPIHEVDERGWPSRADG